MEPTHWAVTCKGKLEDELFRYYCRLWPSIDRSGREIIAQIRFHALPSVYTDRFRYDLEHLFWHPCSHQRVYISHSVSFRKSFKEFLCKKIIWMVYFYFQGITSIHSIFLCLFFIPFTKTKLYFSITFNVSLGRGIVCTFL